MTWLTITTAVLVGLWFCAWLWTNGYKFGVRDTERRWSNAVNRADAWREEETERAKRQNRRDA